MKLHRIFSAALMAAAITATAWAKAPNYIFFFIGDGMGIAQVTNAQLYNARVLGNSTPLLSTTFPVASMATTHSASSDVTDSAAAGTALSTGHKTVNGMLGVTPDSVAVTSVAKKLFDAGYGVGIVTSVAIDDATPGAFYAHVPSRSQYYDIGRQLAECGYQFAAGASLRGAFDKQGNPTDLMKYFDEANVSVSYGLDSIDTTAQRLLVLSPFHKEKQNEIGFTIDSIAGALTLPALTRAGLDQLKRTSPDRFFMMVEGGNIDHAGHGNDGGTILREVINFNQALQEAYDFYLAHPDETLIVVTADHETGGMSVGCRETGYSVRLENAAGQKISKEEFSNLCRAMLRSRRIYTWDDMQEILRDELGFGVNLKLTPEETERLHTMFDEVFEKRASGLDQKTLYATFDGFTNEVFNILNAKSGMGWTTGGHSGMPVPVYAVGVDSQLFSPLNDNTDIPAKILSIAGIEK
jgi:alkaline phosphatase